MSDRYLPFGMTRKPYETVDPDDDEQTILHDFEAEADDT